MTNIINYSLIKDDEVILHHGEYIDAFFHTVLSQASIEYDFDFLVITTKNGKTIRIPSKKKLSNMIPDDISLEDHIKWSNEGFKLRYQIK